MLHDNEQEHANVREKAMTGLIGIGNEVGMELGTFLSQWQCQTNNRSIWFATVKCESQQTKSAVATSFPDSESCNRFAVVC